MDSLNQIAALSYELLLEDQLSDGSWGKSTNDYCFLSTTEEKWKTNWGSITQTCWALLGLHTVFKQKPENVFNRTINLAESYIDSFINNFTKHPFGGKAKNAFDRHVATVLLAKLLLDDILPHNGQKHVNDNILFETYPRLLNKLTERLEQLVSKKESLPTDTIMLAIYPLVVHTMIERDTPKYLLSMIDSWLQISPQIVEVSLKVLQSAAPEKTSSISRVHIWAALLELTSIISGGTNSKFRTVTSELHENAKYYSKRILNKIDLKKLPYFKDNSYYEPWSLLALSLTIGSESENLSHNLSNIILNSLKSSKLFTYEKFVIGGCTHIWAIILRRVFTTGTDLYNQSELKMILDSYGYDLKKFIRMKVNYSTFPRNKQNIISRDCRLFDMYESYFKNKPQKITQKTLDRLLGFYRGLHIVKKKDINCNNIIVGGYSTSGKSEVALFLSNIIDVGTIMPRVTSFKKLESIIGSEEKEYYQFCSKEEIEYMQAELFAIHELANEAFGFKKVDYNSIDHKFRIFQTGWDLNVIEDIKNFCQQKGEETRIIILKTSNDLFNERLRKRWGENSIFREHIASANNFYNSIDEKYIINNDTDFLGDLYAAIFNKISDLLSFQDGYDVAISYSGLETKMADKIRNELHSRGINSFVAASDSLSILKPESQENIDFAFKTTSSALLR